MKKTDLVRASDTKEHLQRYKAKSLNIGSKPLKNISEQNISEILSRFDNAYASLMINKEIPEHKEFCIKTSAPVATDAIVSEDELKDGAVFEVMRDLGTPYAAKIKVALILHQDMPTTNLIHGVYGPYGKTGKGGIYTVNFGQKEIPLPKELSKSESEEKQQLNSEYLKFWNGENGKNGHVFLATPDELVSTIEQMKKFGMKTQLQELYLDAFQKGGQKSPLKSKHKQSEKDKEVIDLGEVKLLD